MSNEFEQRRDQYFADADPDETAALRYVKSWHRHPQLHDALWYRGVNLGEMDEYLLLAAALKTMLRHAGRLPE